MNPGGRLRLRIACAVLASLAWLAASARLGDAAPPAAENPEHVVSAFYQALGRGDCAKVDALWPGFGEASCRATSDVNLMANRVMCSDERTAVVLIELTYIRTDGKARSVEIFHGYTTLDRADSRSRAELANAGWLIREGAFRPQEAITLEAYSRDVARVSVPCATRPEGPAPLPGAAPRPLAGPSQAPAAQPQAAQPVSPTPQQPRPLPAPSGPALSAPLKPAPLSAATQPLPQGLPSSPPPPPRSGQSYYAPALEFGSQVVLEACWSVAERAGTEEDKLIKLQPAASRPLPPRGALLSPLRPLPVALQNSIRRVEQSGYQKLVALTFDLCEQQHEIAGYDAAIVEYLRKNGVKATFFAGGKWMATHPDKTMQLMADPLFEIGNHSWTHANLRQLRGREMEEQILWTQAQYEVLRERLQELYAAQRMNMAEMEKIPKAIQVFRFPYGTCNAESLRALAGFGLPAIQWDVVTGDPGKEQTAEGISRVVLSETKSGSIVICHANGRGAATAKAVAQFVPKLREKGYHFVTVSELLTLGTPLATPDCYERKPGDNLKYDR